MSYAESPDQLDAIAIIGMACRFPGAPNVDAFWRNLRDGVEAISFFSDDELRASGIDPAALRDPSHVRAGSVLEDIDRFDAPFFDFSPRQAELTDPQHRLFLECAWETLESAGCDPAGYAGSIGVFAGSIISNYLLFNLYPALGYTGTLGNLQTLIGNDKDYLATHTSYKLNLKGPSVNVQTACSTSLVAVHLACQSLLNGECDMALAGGIAVRVPQKAGYFYQDGGIFSPDGHCRPFDAKAQGTIFGNGVGIVVLKRLSDALADGDRIEAIIKGSAINNDGSLKVGYTAPGEDGQAEVIAEALALAQIDPETISYIETHGTGTPLGDPIEVAALTRVFRAQTQARGFCALGAVKSNLGHLEAAAGIAGLIKTILALQHGQLPPSLNYEAPNPQIAFADTPFYVNARLAGWEANGTPRRAGVSSFGIGGTNAHVILEEAPQLLQPCTPDDHRAYLLPLSARTPAALQDLIRVYRDFLPNEESGAALALYDLCYTASLRRRHHEQRLAVVGHSHEELVERLAALQDRVNIDASDSNRSGKSPANRRKVVFVFPGQGAQWLGMGRQLLEQEPVFREKMEGCDHAMRSYVDWSLLKELAANEAQSRLNDIDVIQPILFAMQVSLAALWRAWGIEPDAVVGHSMGEVAAAHIAGALSLDAAARIICRRSKLLRRVSGRGAMAVVGLTVEQARMALADYTERLSVAVSNSPKSTVLSGDPDALKAVVARLESQSVFCRWIKVDVASHSPQMDCLRPDLLSALHGTQPQTASVPMFSTVIGRIVNGPELDADYWTRNLREPVMFAAAVQTLLESGHDIFVEISPHPILLPAIEDSLYHLSHTGTVVASLRRESEERAVLLESLGSLYALGQPVNWAQLYPDKGRCVRLPSYPWQRQRYWLEPARGARLSAGAGAADLETWLHPLLGRRLCSALKDIQFESQLSATRLPYLADHRVCGQVIFPATAYLEMAQAAGAIAWNASRCVVENVLLREPLILSEAAQTVQAILTPEGPAAGTFQVFSREGDAETWRLHASGGVRVAHDDVAPADSALAAAQARCPEELPGEIFYQHLHERGFEYGPGFQGIEHIRRGEGEALALVHLPESLAAARDPYSIHPTLLDACLQAFGAAFGGVDKKSVYLPMSIERFQVYASPGERVWSHAVLRSASDTQRDMPTGDVTVFDEAGQLIARVTGLCAKRTSRATLQRAASARAGEWLYQLQWQPQARTQTALHGSTAGRWLIFADRSGAGQALAAQLMERSETCALVFADQAQENFEQVLMEADAPYRGIVHLWSLDATTPEQTTPASLQADQTHICGSILNLIQALAKTEWPHAPKVWLVTRGAQPVGEGTSLAVAQAPIWGLGRTIALEHPDLHCARVDLDPTGDANDVRDLLEEIVARDEEDQVAFRDGQRYAPRLVRAMQQETPKDQPLRLEIPARGVLDNLILEPDTRCQPGRGEVEIRVWATGLNFRDVLNALGMYPGEAGPLGLECAGEIVAVGEGVGDFRAGDEVVAFAAGAFRSFVTVPADLVALKPARLSFEEAATIPVTFMTAYYGLHHLAQMKASDRILIHAAAGGVGLAAVQLAQRAGAEVFATAGSSEKREFLRSLGVQHLMNSRTLDFAGEVMAQTDGQGVDIVLNSLSGDFIPKSVSVLSAGGRFVEIGKIGIWDTSQVAGAKPDAAYFAFDLGQEARKDPTLIGGMLRALMQEFDRGTLKPLPLRGFPIQESISAFRYMSQARHIGKIVITQAPTPPGASFDGFRPDGSYLITGGLGDLGLLVAGWMVEQGARHLALVGRSAPSDRAIEAVHEMEQARAHIRIARADVADAEQVANVLDDVARSMPPLRGIIHAAGLLDDGVLLRQDWDRFSRVCAPKVQGAWNLHTLTHDQPLDLFVMFSSTASLLGSPGQGSYAAANAFMDALAHHRQAQGLPALSINWSGWAEIGLAARHGVEARMALQGIEPIVPQLGLLAFERALHQRAAQVAVLPVDWQKLIEPFAIGGEPPVLSELVREMKGRSAPAGHSELMRRLESAPPGNRQDILATFMCEQARKVLGLGASVALNPQQPLNELGLDSLMAIELRNTLGQAVGRTLPATLLFDHPTIESLSGYLAQEVLHLSNGDGAQAPAELPDRETAESSERRAEIEWLSDDALEQLLAEEIEAAEALVNGE